MRALVVARSEDVDALLGNCNKKRKKERKGGKSIRNTLHSSSDVLLSVCVYVQREGSGATDESAQADAANQKEVKIPPTLFPFMEGCPNSFLL